MRVEVWDWDRNSTDDPLGHFEVNVGEELLSKKVCGSGGGGSGYAMILCDII